VEPLSARTETDITHLSARAPECPSGNRFKYTIDPSNVHPSSIYIFNMSGRNNNCGGGNCQGRGNGGGRGRGNGPKPKITGGSNKKGAEEKLGDHIFTYGTHNAADQMRQTWKYITTYVGNAYSGDMMTELHDRKTYVIPEPAYTDAVKTAHAATVVKYKARIDREIATQRCTLSRLQANPTPSSTTIMHIGDTEDEISSLEEASTEEPPLVLTGADLEKRQAGRKEYDKANSRNKEHRKQVFALILGQVTPNLLGQLENKKTWSAIYTKKDPLELYDLIEKTVQQKTEDNYVYAVVISELERFLALRQHHATPEAYYDTFTGRTDVSKNIGLFLGHTTLSF
jgi:hypothetical protein